MKIITGVDPFSDRLCVLPEQAVLADLSAVLVLLIISMRRYTDGWLRARRALPLTAAAEAQWDLLPPLACSTSCFMSWRPALWKATSFESTACILPS